MYVYVHAFICTYIHIYVCIYEYVFACIKMYSYARARAHTHTHKHTTQVPICLMHYRGDPATMTGLANYPDDTVAAVAAELQQRYGDLPRHCVWRALCVDLSMGLTRRCGSGT